MFKHRTFLKVVNEATKILELMYKKIQFKIKFFLCKTWIHDLIKN